jgi:site-specific recombinase XerD
MTIPFYYKLVISQEIFSRTCVGQRLKAALKLSKYAVIHSFRHTFGTRLGEAGADAFTTMRAMGRSSVVVGQKYIHPTPERWSEPLRA